MNRRKFIKATGTGALTAIVAGCNGQTGNGGDETTTGEETTTGGETTTGEQTTTGEGTTASGQLQTRVGNTPPDIKISDLRINRSEDAGAVLLGTLTYTGNQQLEEVEVQATLYDSTDDILGQFFDNSESESFAGPLKSGETWDFRIRFENADLGQAAGVQVDVDTEVDENVDINLNTSAGNETTTA